MIPTPPESAASNPSSERQFVDHGVGPLRIGPDLPAAVEISEFYDNADTPAPEHRLREMAFENEGGALPGRRGLVRRLFGFIGWTISTLFGIISLILLLAIIAAIPILNFLALGYLLDVEGRVARSGRIRDAFPLLDLAPRLGSIALGIWLWLLPVRWLSTAAADARLIDPGATADRLLHGLLRVAVVVIAVHLCLALARGGRLSCFFRPIKNIRWIWRRWQQGNYWNTATAAVSEFVDGLQFTHHFVLGVKGWVGAMIWLAIPTALFAAANKTEGLPILVTISGGLLLVAVLSWVPFLQARFAAENRFGAMFELREIRRLYKHAPISWFVTLLVTLTLALPMYLFKVALPPQDAMWLITVVFIVSIYPVKVMTGWAYHRAVARDRRAHFLLRAPSWLLRTALLMFYVFLLFFTQFIGEHGKGVLFEHHAFLLPVPF